MREIATWKSPSAIIIIIMFLFDEAKSKQSISKQILELFIKNSYQYASSPATQNFAFLHAYIQNMEQNNFSDMIICEAI